MTPFSSACPVCDQDQLQVVFETARSLPVFSNVLHDDEAAALGAGMGQVRLAVCAVCGHLFNAAHDPELLTYGPGYENSLHFSPTFEDYARGLAARLVADHALRGGVVLEVGSGKGDFLALLVEQGVGRAVGYDPSYAGEQQDRLANGRVSFVRGMLPEAVDAGDVDLVVARHVLEHLDRPREVMGVLRRALRSDPPVVLYAEVPDGAYLLRKTALWDVIYEHPSHFTDASLHRLLTGAGLCVEALGSSFGDQYLWFEASSASGGTGCPAPAVDHLLAEARDFAGRATALVQQWSHFLAEERRAGRRTALWGTGSKGVTFLNAVPGAAQIEQVVDINPRKHGKHVPGTAQRVIGPEGLVADPPDSVVVLNPLYAAEVEAVLRRLDVPAVVVVGVTAPVD